MSQRHFLGGFHDTGGCRPSQCGIEQRYARGGGTAYLIRMDPEFAKKEAGEARPTTAPTTKAGEDSVLAMFVLDPE